MEDIIKEIEEEVRYCHKLRHIWHINPSFKNFKKLDNSINHLVELTNIKIPILKGDFQNNNLEIRAYLKKISDNFNLECYVQPHGETNKWSYGNDYNKKGGQHG